MLEIGIENIKGIRKTYDTMHYSGDEIGVIRKKDRIVGYYIIYREASDSAYLELLYIAEGEKEKGYGQEFFHEIFKQYPDIEYINGLSQDGSRDFYKQIGAIFEESCNACDDTICSKHPINESEAKETDLCEAYFDNYFTIERSNYYNVVIPGFVPEEKNV